MLAWQVMKLYAGSLADLLRRDAPLPQLKALEYCAQVAAALAELHGLRPAIAVLDLKPDNLLVDAEAGGRLVVADFGALLSQTATRGTSLLPLTEVSDHAGISKKVETVSQVFSPTAGGGGGGTPGFMAPEQYDRKLYGPPGADRLCLAPAHSSTSQHTLPTPAGNS